MGKHVTWSVHANPTSLYQLKASPTVLPNRAISLCVEDKLFIAWRRVVAIPSLSKNQALKVRQGLERERG